MTSGTCCGAVLLHAVNVCCYHWLIKALAYGIVIVRQETQERYTEKAGRVKGDGASHRLRSKLNGTQVKPRDTW